MAPVFHTSNNIFFQTIHPLEQKLNGRHQGKTETLNCSNLSIQISKMTMHYSYLGIFQIISSKPKPSWAETRQHGGSEWIKSFYSDIKDGQELNNNLDILQTTSSSKPYVLLSRNLIGCVKPKGDWEMVLSFHSNTKDGHELNSHLGFLQLLPNHIFSWAKTWWKV